MIQTLSESMASGAANTLGNPVAIWSALTGQKVPAGLIAKHNNGDWLCVKPNRDSEPISGNADWTLVGGTPYVKVTLGEDELTTIPFFDVQPEITGVNQGTKTFSFGSLADGYLPGMEVAVTGSTGNDRDYTIASVGATTITVNEAIPSAVANGFLYGPGLLAIPAPGADLTALPLGPAMSVVDDGDAWGSSAAPVVKWEDANGPSTPIANIPDSLDRDLSSDGRLNVFYPSDAFLVSPPGGVNQPVIITTSVDVSSGGTGTRRVTYIIPYIIIKATPDV